MSKRRDRSTFTSASTLGFLNAEMVEELEDAADANRILSQTDPSTWHSLDELRKAVRTDLLNEEPRA